MILAYHGINNHKKDKLHTATNVFEAQVQFFKRKKYRCEDYLSNTYKGKHKLHFTFDDGQKDCIENAYPILHKYGFRGTVYIIVNTLLKKPIFHISKERKFLTIEDIKFLKASGWQIGCHTFSHKRLILLNKKQQKREIIESKIALEDLCQFEINSFCCPGGWFDRTSLELIQNAQYTSSVVTPRNPISYLYGKKVMLHRMSPGNTLPNLKFFIKISRFGSKLRLLHLILRQHLMRNLQFKDIEIADYKDTK